VQFQSPFLCNVRSQLTQEVRRLAGDGTSLRVLGTSASTSTYRSGSSQRVTERAFSPRVVVAAFPREVCYAHTAVFSVRCVDTLGANTRLVVGRRAARTVTDSMVRAWRDAMSGKLPSGGSRYVGSLRVHRERVAREAEVMRALPAIGRLLAAGTGDLWISGYQPSDGIPSGTGAAPGVPAGTTEWTVYGPTGAPKATLRTPARFRVLHAGDGWLLGVARDEDDVERVELWRIQPEQPRR